jgi:hypothetical protein
MHSSITRQQRAAVMAVRKESCYKQQINYVMMCIVICKRCACGAVPAGPATSTSTSKSPFQSATKTRTADTNVSGGDQRQRSIALVNEGLEVRRQQQQQQQLASAAMTAAAALSASSWPRPRCQHRW